MEEVTKEQLEKLENLQNYLKELKSVAVAFSSGVDSTFLLKVAKDMLKDKVIAVTAQSCSFPKRELNEAIEFCDKENIKHFICESEELSIEGFAAKSKKTDAICARRSCLKRLKLLHRKIISKILQRAQILMIMEITDQVLLQWRNLE